MDQVSTLLVFFDLFNRHFFLKVLFRCDVCFLELPTRNDLRTHKHEAHGQSHQVPLFGIQQSLFQNEANSRGAEHFDATDIKVCTFLFQNFPRSMGIEKLYPCLWPY